MSRLFLSLVGFIKRFFVKVGHVQALVLLTLFYILFIVPLGLLKGRRSDMMGIKKPEHAASFWTKRSTDKDLQRFSRKQY